MGVFRNPVMRGRAGVNPNAVAPQTPTPDDQQAAPSGNPLAGFFGGDGSGWGQGQGYDDDPRSRLNKVGALMMMLDPMSAAAGTSMLGLQQTRAANRQQKKNANATASWLTKQGVGADEANFLASDPQALSSWYSAWKSGSKPNWQLQDITTEDGTGTQKFMVNMNNPSQMTAVGGIKPLDPNGQVVAPGSTVYKNGKPVFTAPADDSKAPTIQSFYDKQSGLEYKAQWNPETKQWDMQGGQKAPTGETSFTVNPDGTVTYTQGGKGGGAGKTTEAEQKTTGFLTRMADAEPDINAYGEKMTTFGNNALQMAPGMVRKVLQGKEYKQGQRAGRSWLTGVLRGDSGGAITDPEWEDYGEIFIPQFGDGPDDLKQKARMREAVVRGLKAGMSNAARESVLKAIAAGGVPDDDAGDAGGGNQPPPAATAPPKIGEVRDGYSYKGGDPALPSSWAAVTGGK
jgi:hypothetical protein